jgi:hypothetical protein
MSLDRSFAQPALLCQLRRHQKHQAWQFLRAAGVRHSLLCLSLDLQALPSQQRNLPRHRSEGCPQGTPECPSCVFLPGAALLHLHQQRCAHHSHTLHTTLPVVTPLSSPLTRPHPLSSGAAPPTRQKAYLQDCATHACLVCSWQLCAVCRAAFRVGGAATLIS